MFNFDNYLKQVLSLGTRSSALAPLLWLNALVSIPCIFLSAFIQTPFRWAPFFLATVIVIYTLIMYLRLKRINPRLLQSERFQMEMHKLDIVAQKGGPIIIDPVNLPLSEGPKSIAGKATEEQEES